MRSSRNGANAEAGQNPPSHVRSTYDPKGGTPTVSAYIKLLQEQRVKAVPLNVKPAPAELAGA